jgi:hypothetical protein
MRGVVLLLLVSLPVFAARNGPEMLGNTDPDEYQELLPSMRDYRTAIALVPLWGVDSDIVAEFGEVLRDNLERGGTYRPVPVDMERLPADVPPGGFPPYVCPSPSLTGQAPYSITGEVVQDESDAYHLRLYLWEMANARLAYTDEITVRDREECERFLPPSLEWLLSHLPEPPWKPAAPAPVPVTEDSGLRLPVPDYYRLYLGMKVGSAFRFYSRPPDSVFLEDDVAYFFNISAGFQFAWYFLPFLGLQAEVEFTSDHAPFRTVNKNKTDSLSAYNAPFTSYSLSFPLLLKYSFRRNAFVISALAGGYLFVPLGDMRNEALVPDSGGLFNYGMEPPIGYIAGIDLGTKIGPGNLFLDLRWAQDLGMIRAVSGETVYKRGMFSIAIGYELGFVPGN